MARTVSQRLRVVTVVAAVLALVAAAVVVGRLLMPSGESSVPTAVPPFARWTAPLPAPGSSAVPSPAATPSASGAPSSTSSCGTAFVPARLAVERLGVAIEVLSLPLAADGTFPVPPYEGGPDPRWSAAWWRDGAKPGAGKGSVHVDVHTYTDGSAVGNLFGNRARVGDVIQLLDAKGVARASYRISEITTWPVAEVPIHELSRPDTSPRLVIEFCWETPYRWGDHVWRLRRNLIAEQTC